MADQSSDESPAHAGQNIAMGGGGFSMDIAEVMRSERFELVADFKYWAAQFETLVKTPRRQR